MFTGLVEELGWVESIRFVGKSGEIAIRSTEVLSDLAVGDSVAVNGVCLTVVDISSDKFKVDVMKETVERSNLYDFKKDTPVNLERSMRLGDRLGGHLVNGHIDCMGVIKLIDIQENAKVFTIEIRQKGLERYLVEKGSIAVDGISLTIVKCLGQSFTVSIIPHTLGFTTLAYKKEGDRVNLEVDIIAKYLEKLSYGEKGKGISLDFLAEKGFL